MNLDVLMNTYSNDARILKIADRILFPEPQHIHLSGLLGSASQFIFSAIFNHPVSSKVNYLVILRDAEEAAYFHNTIENLTNALDVFYFPSSFKNKKNFHQLNSSHVMLRTEALTKLSAGGNKKVLVTYAEALFEKVVLSKSLSENIISFKTGENLKVDELLSRFVDHGFSRTDFVYEPGQFAVRGGILDIYSYGNEKPYRIELFGNEIDSIRLFDPETQLSERKLLQVNIIPNVETQFSSGEKVSLLNFLPENTAVWSEDWEFIKQIIEQQEEDLKSAISNPPKANVNEEIELNEIKKISEKDFVNAAILEKQIEERPIIEFGKNSFFSKNNEINFSIQQQPAFNRQFNLLIENLKSFETKKYNIFIFAENPKQLERLHSIFRDQNTEINFVPIPVSIHEGFIDNDLKLLCYTDHEIFQRYHKYKVKQAFSKNKALTLKMLRELQPGDYVTHIDHGVGVFSGLQKIEANGVMQESVR
ncbi:MAG TPA: CarD family transcriptional regulator, partial [Hanamia sp.]|nr:CarD family transcriptional regulator [Hanamia sp.]